MEQQKGLIETTWLKCGPWNNDGSQKWILTAS